MIPTSVLCHIQVGKTKLCFKCIKCVCRSKHLSLATLIVCTSTYLKDYQALIESINIEKFIVIETKIEN